jgi:hypothetical protein
MENYVGWATKMQYALVCEDHWCHVNTKAEPGDLLGQPSIKPVPVDLDNLMSTEITAMCEWLLEDMKAKELIIHHLSSLVTLLIPHSHDITAHKAWQILQEHFNYTDMSTQYLLRQQVQALQIKNSANATNYITQHADFCKHLLNTNTPWGETDAIYHMLMGLPQTPIWQQFKSLLEQQMHNKSMAASPPTVPTFTFESCVFYITSEAACHIMTQHAWLQ